MLSAENGLGEEEEEGEGDEGEQEGNPEQQEQQEEEDLDDAEDASQLERRMRERRRARSLPAYPAALLGDEARSKRVTFADARGLDLARVRHFSTLEEPHVPSKVLSRHRSFPPQQPDAGFRAGPLDSDRLVRCFPEPRDTARRLRRLRVALEGVHISRFDVRGHIRALAPGPGHRVQVGVRYTFNDWLSHVDAQALPVPVPDGEEGAGEAGLRFGFTVYTPPVLDPHSAVHFAVYLRSSDGEFWDNNEGRNYTLRYRCLPDGGAFVSAAFHAT